MQTIIRKGIKEDAAGVLALIKELAEYEKAPNDVVITVEQLQDDGFGNNPIYGLFVAEQNNKIVGIALYYWKYSTWKGRCIFLEDIIVTEKLRGQKIGAQLFEEVIKVAKEAKVQRMEWQVLNWNAPAINFYKKYNANLDDEWLNGKLVFEQIQFFGD